MTSDSDPSPLFATKLSPPRLGASMVRPDQLAQMADAARARLLLVRAPAGYGKTTLVVAAAAEFGWPCVWYRLDALDADPHAFLAAFRRALAASLSGLDESLTDWGREPGARPAAAEAGAQLAAEIARLAGDELFLILDDYELVAGEAAFNLALAALLSYLPPNVHVLLLGRVRPAFPTAKLALEGGLAQLTAQDLRLDRAQVAAVVERECGAPPTATAVEALHGLTEGWAAGVVIAAQAAQRQDARSLDEALAGGGVEPEFFPYFAEETYERQGLTVQRFLRRTCCLRSLTPVLAETISGVRGAGLLLERLEAGGVFTVADPTAGEYAYHPLFRAFLKARLVAEDGQAALTGLQRRSALVLSDCRDATGALELFLDAGDPEATIELLREAGYALLDVTARPLLARWAEALSRESGHSGWASLLNGQLLLLIGDLDSARRRLDMALASLCDDRIGRYLCLRMRTHCSYLAGADEEAAEHALQALEAADAPDKAECLFALTQALSVLCRWREFDEALAAFAECESVSPDLSARMAVLTIHRLYSSGDVRACLVAAENALPTVRRDSSNQSTVNLLYALANFNLFACRYARGRRILEEARREADACGLARMRSHLDRAEAAFLAQEGRLRECLILLDDLLAEPFARTSPLMESDAHYASCVALRRAGEPHRALESCRRALRALPDSGSTYDRLEVQIDLAFLEGLTGIPKQVSTRLRSLSDEASGCGLSFLRAKTGFFLGVLQLRAGDGGTSELSWSCAELLRLGHLDNLGQELVANPEAAAWLPAADLDDEALREVLRTVAVQATGAQLAASLASQSARILSLLLSLARTDLPARQATLLLQALRRSRSKVVRDRARRLDLGADAAETRLFLELTPREEEVLTLLAEGFSNEQVARRLVLSLGTVKTHVHRILSKTGAAGRLAAAMLYRERAEATATGLKQDASRAAATAHADRPAGA